MVRRHAARDYHPSMTSRRRARFRWLRTRICAILLALGAVLSLTLSMPQAQEPNQRTAVVLAIDGIIGPATADYVVRGLAQAKARHAKVALLRMDTPGGLDTSMRDIIRAILASPVPVLTYVTPGGARAASAGTYILYASHVAAMAPGTNLGAATPVAIGGLPTPGRGDDGKGQGGASDKPGAADTSDTPASDAPRSRREPASASEAKAINDAVAYIRSLAELRGRDADWAELAVRDAASLSASAALERNVIDIVASDVDDLQRQADAWGIKVANVEIKHIDLDESMIRVIARQAEAERERRAKVISAEGEQQAAQKLAEAAEILSLRPEAMQLRYLSTLAQIGSQNSSTIVFPFPTDVAGALAKVAESLKRAD